MHQESDEQEFQMEHFDKRGEIKMQLSSTAQKIATDIINNSEFTCLLNNHLDPFNKAESQLCPVSVQHAVEFENYFIKYKHRDQRSKVFDTLRDLLIERGYNQISQVRDREQEQIMVVRVVQKADNLLNTFIIEDQFGKDKLVVKQGLMWVGMICAIKAKWIQGTYKLQKIIDLSNQIPQTKAQLSANMSVNRIMFVKGPFRLKFRNKDNKNEDSGIRIITKQIEKLRKNNIIINQLVVMGPILAKNNDAVQKFTLQRTYEEQYEFILASLRAEVSKVNNNIQIYVMPSLDDIVSLYPIPQPAYNPQDKRVKIKRISNPSSLKIQATRTNYKIDLINYDILKYIQTHKAGKNTKQLRQQIFETYIKQPFLLTNTTTSRDSFDEINIGQLFNNGNFGDLVVYSSNISPPVCTEVNGRIIMNIGSLGFDHHYTGKNFIVIASIYEGIGPVSQRTKVQVISHG